MSELNFVPPPLRASARGRGSLGSASAGNADGSLTLDRRLWSCAQTPIVRRHWVVRASRCCGRFR